MTDPKTLAIMQAIADIRGPENCNAPPAAALHYDVPFKTYLSWPCASNSDGKATEISPATWLSRQVEPFTATGDMDVGSGADTLWLEGPARYDEDFEHADCESRRSKAYKEAAAETAKTCLTVPEVARVQGIVASLDLDEAACALRECLAAQVSITWIDAAGIPRKARPDLAGIVSDDCARVVNAHLAQDVLPLRAGDHLVTDLKTTFDNAAEAFRRTMFQLRYHFQSGHYSDGYEAVTGERPRWMWLTAKSKPEHGVELYDMPDHAVALGSHKMDGILGTLAACLLANTFPASSGRITILDLPPWAYRED